jgi:hypothetical protein
VQRGTGHIPDVAVKLFFGVIGLTTGLKAR